MSLEEHYLADIRSQFAEIKAFAERALAQVPDDDLVKAIDAESNSLAVIVKHMAGNLRSRFTDFLTTDGEKPDRDRDGEFEVDETFDRQEMMAHWTRGWSALSGTLDALTPGDLLADVFIRGERHTVLRALQRALAHQAQHAGQVVFLAKHLRSTAWRTLTIPRVKVRSKK